MVAAKVDSNEAVGERTAVPGQKAKRGNLINDYDFITNLDHLKKLRAFLQREAVKLEPDQVSSLSFGSLNLLHFSSEGRDPTDEEWCQIEGATQRLYSHLTEDLRRKFVMGNIPMWVPVLPIALIFIALVALVTGIVCYMKFQGLPFVALPFYLIWLLSLGAIGAVAFLGMNILSVQQDITFDLSNKRFILLRIVLGALFGLVLTLPFGFSGFLLFIDHLSGRSEPKADPSGQDVTTQALLLLLPFVLGFSTSLVIMILNRVIVGVQAFFGTTKEVALPASMSGAEPVKLPAAGGMIRRPLRDPVTTGVR
jgi:hypothetical protein